MRRGLSIILLSALAFLCCAFVSTNVPLNHWSYDAIDKLIGQGLIDSAMMTTRPVSRLEMARHIVEAIEKSQQLNERNEIILAILDRLKEEFKADLIIMGLLDGESVENFIKPIEDPYVKYVFANKKPDLENQRGDIFDRHSNYRVGFASRMKFFDSVALYLHPEYVDSSSAGDGDVELIEGYGKLALGNLEVEIGKDSLWWGPGYHGSMLISNNVEPFKMIKVSNPHPVQLPWIFRSFGPFKAVWFLTELEENRAIPWAKLTGLRFNFKPHPNVEIGLSRTIMFAGSGVPNTDLGDYLAIFWPKNEQGYENQLASINASLLVPLNGKIPAKSIKLYTDFTGEDAAGISKYTPLLGIQLNDILRTGRTDLRIEYADNNVSGYPNVFYTHGIYQSGHTYKGRIIGHHMGTDARDLYIRLTHYLTKDLILGVEFDREVGRHVGDLSAPHQTTNQLGFDLTFFTTNSWQLNTSYRYEDSKNDSIQDNHIFQLQLIREF